MMRGHDEAMFVDPDAVDEDFLCGICTDVLRQPVSCKKGHTFCTDCIHEWLDGNNKTCPMDRQKLKKGDLGQSRIVENLINKLQVYCTNCESSAPAAKVARKSKGAASASSSGGGGGGGGGGGSASRPAAAGSSKRAREAESAGCDWKGPLSSQENHVANHCPFTTVCCPLVGCSIRVVRSALDHHQSQCGFRMVACADCAVQVQGRGVAAHKRACPKAQVQCVRRCDASMCRDEQVQHEGVCLLQPVACPFQPHGCTAGVKRRDFDAHQVEAAADHAAMVSTKVAAMEAAATADRAELAAVNDRAAADRAAATADRAELAAVNDRAAADRAAATAALVRSNARLAALEARPVVAAAGGAGSASRAISWKVPVAAKHSLDSPNCVFTLPGGETYQVGILVEFTTPGWMSVFIRISSVTPGGVSLSRFPVHVGGSTITVKHRAVGGRDVTMTMPADTAISVDDHSRGWRQFLSLDRMADFTAADGSLQIKATVRANVPEETVLE
jgi:hypothetical protein